MRYRTDLPPLDLELDLEALERAVRLTVRERLVDLGNRANLRLRRTWRDTTLVALLVLVAGIVHG